MPLCVDCGQELDKEAFSASQLKRRKDKRCKQCVGPAAPTTTDGHVADDPPAAPMDSAATVSADLDAKLNLGEGEGGISAPASGAIAPPMPPPPPPPPQTGASAGTAMEAEELKLKLSAWYDTLRDEDEVWRALQTEKAAGWASTAVEEHWRRRELHFERHLDRKQGKQVPSTRKYVRFYEEWLPKIAPQLFKANGPPRTFADTGSSPGGMCETLIKLYGWNGSAFSLPVAIDGFGMSFAHPDLAYHDADLALEDSWKGCLHATGEQTCDFVNLGIVVDRGQKTSDQKKPSLLENASEQGQG